MRVSLIETVRMKLAQQALPLGVFAATALVAAIFGPIAAGNMTVHEIIHDVRHALGLPCH